MRGLENRKEQTRQTRKSPAHSRHNAELHTQKKRCSISCGALLHAHLSGFQARPLNFQRRKKVTDSPSHPATARARRKNLLESESVSDHSHKFWSAVRPLSRASSLPHRFLVVYKISVHRRSRWEPSLLAMAVGLLASMLNVPPPSRAGSLPQLD